MPACGRNALQDNSTGFLHSSNFDMARSSMVESPRQLNSKDFASSTANEEVMNWQHSLRDTSPFKK